MNRFFEKKQKALNSIQSYPFTIMFTIYYQRIVPFKAGGRNEVTIYASYIHLFSET